MASIEILQLLFPKAGSNVQVMLLLEIDIDVGLGFPCNMYGKIVAWKIVTY